MKKILLIALAVLLCLSLCVPSSAAIYEAAAKELNDAGIIEGTGDSLELDRAPNRAETAAMVVRLYGAEEEAKADFAAGKITHPFTDVPEWADPYVAWLFSKELTRGISDTEFGSANLCSGHDYSVFMLRALGYKDGVDFDYFDAGNYAEELGFYSTFLFDGEFLRDDMTAVTRQALVTDMKESDKTLIENLAESGAVTEDAAKELLDKSAAAKELQELMGSEITAIDTDIKADMTMKDGDQASAFTMKGSLKLIMPDENDIMTVSLASLLSIAMDEESMDFGVWLKEGWIYLSTEAEGETLQLKMDISFITELMKEVEQTGSMFSIPQELSMTLFDSIEKTGSGDNVVYTCTMTGETIMGLISKLLGESMSEMLNGYDIGDITVAYTFVGGELKSVEESFSMSATAYDENGEEYVYSVDCSVSLAVNAVNNGVSIEFPDFSEYIDFTALLENVVSELDTEMPGTALI
ncbi:MAG: hypothetical protein IKR21_03225 [Oscillospiraceae bacterium]|nr:hypothetical protein [Oscillospiraceae bacterium]